LAASRGDLSPETLPESGNSLQDNTAGATLLRQPELWEEHRVTVLSANIYDADAVEEGCFLCGEQQVNVKKKLFFGLIGSGALA